MSSLCHPLPATTENLAVLPLLAVMMVVCTIAIRRAASRSDRRPEELDDLLRQRRELEQQVLDQEDRESAPKA